MKITEKTKKELLEISQSFSMKKDMQKVVSNRLNPFIRDGKVDRDAYIEFVSQFNEFINHAPKTFRPIIDRIMKL